MSQGSLACFRHILGTVQVCSPAVVMDISKGYFGVSSAKLYPEGKDKPLGYTLLPVSP